MSRRGAEALARWQKLSFVLSKLKIVFRLLWSHRVSRALQTCHLSQHFKVMESRCRASPKQLTNSFEVQTAAPPLLHPRYNTFPASLRSSMPVVPCIVSRRAALHTPRKRVVGGEAVQSRYRTSRNVPQLPRSRHWSHATGTGRRGQRNQRWGLLGGGWRQPSSGPGLA